MFWLWVLMTIKPMSWWTQKINLIPNLTVKWVEWVKSWVSNQQLKVQNSRHRSWCNHSSSWWRLGGMYCRVKYIADVNRILAVSFWCHQFVFHIFSYVFVCRISLSHVISLLLSRTMNRKWGRKLCGSSRHVWICSDPWIRGWISYKSLHLFVTLETPYKSYVKHVRFFSPTDLGWSCHVPLCSTRSPGCVCTKARATDKWTTAAAHPVIAPKAHGWLFDWFERLDSALWVLWHLWHLFH